MEAGRPRIGVVSSVAAMLLAGFIRRRTYGKKPAQFHENDLQIISPQRVQWKHEPGPKAWAVADA
jgi:hypothetical protein